jgi:hypothetical protein
MTSAPRRFHCVECNRTATVLYEVVAAFHCAGCGRATIEIDKLGQPLPVTLARAPAIEREGVRMTERQAGMARRLIASLGMEVAHGVAK